MRMDSSYFLPSELACFLDSSPSPYHAVLSMKRKLEAQGFSELKEDADWSLVGHGRYYVCRQQTSLIAFIVGEKHALESQFIKSKFLIIGAHTDSPCLKLKPKPIFEHKKYLQCAVEVYGSPILATWLDRDLGLAGRVVYFDETTQTLHDQLVCIDKPVLRIPSLAIHLQRDVNQNGLKINPQTQLAPIWSVNCPESVGKDSSIWPLLSLDAHLSIQLHQLRRFDLCLFDTQKTVYAGAESEFVQAARLDNLACCLSGLQALLKNCELPQEDTRVLVCYDHEEVGSTSACGAQSSFLEQVLRRIIALVAPAQLESVYAQMMARSWFVSADMAHAIHPNYADMHDSNHFPVLGKGPVLKNHACLRYGTDGYSGSYFEQLCRESMLDMQYFSMRNDLSCGSTIGPISASTLGVHVVDVGAPMLSMHSIREMAHIKDIQSLCAVLNRFYTHPLQVCA